MPEGDILSILRTAQTVLARARLQMAMSGATPDALREANDDLEQLESWVQQSKSTMDKALVRKTATRWLETYLDYSFWGKFIHPARRAATG